MIQSFLKRLSKSSTFSSMKNILMLCVVMVSIATLTAQQETKESTEIENALLWEISGNGLSESSYIYGTMHVGDKRILEYGDSVKAAIHSVDAVYGEVDLTDLAGQMAVMGDMLMPTNTLKDLVSEEEYATISMVLEGTPSALMMDQIKPFFTMGSIATMFLPAEDIQVIDMHFLELGKKLGKETGGIETMKEQVAVVNSLTLQEQAEMLVEMCEEFDEQKVLFLKMYEAYLKQDLNQLTEIAESEMEDLSNSKFEAELLEKRNVTMVDRLTKMMGEKSVFFAVGALHLTSEKGLIELLEAKGYTIEAIKS